MMRQLAPVVLVAAAVLPDWATAFTQHVVVTPIVFEPGPCVPITFAPPCLPVFPLHPLTPSASPDAIPSPAIPPPTATPERNVQPDSPPTAPPRVQIEPASSPTSPTGDVTPASGQATPAESTPIPPVDSTSVPLNKPRDVPPEPQSSPARPAFEVPTLRPAQPPANGVNIPPTPVPTGPTRTNKPGESNPPIVPKLTPSTPGGDSLPALDLPGASRTARSSPVNKSKVDVYPLAAGRVAGAAITAEFTNLTDADVALTVEGQTITLPVRHSVLAVVPATFEWQLADGPNQSATVPVDAAGVEVLIRR